MNSLENEHRSASEPTESADATARGVKQVRRAHRDRFLRWTILVPCLTAAIFGGLFALTFLEIDWKRAEKSSERRPSAREVTAEVLARYRAETAKLGEIREAKRAGLTAEAIVAIFAPSAGGEEGARALPARATLLADFQALRKRSPESVPRLLRALVPVWREALKREDLRPGELELLSELFLQAAVSLDAAPSLKDSERAELFSLFRDLLRHGESGLGGLLVYLSLVAMPADLATLRELAGEVRGTQHREEIRRILDRLEKRASNWKVADAR